MEYVIQPRKITLGGNSLLVKRLSRRDAAAFAESMKAAGDDAAEMERIGLALIAGHVTFEDGSAICVDDLPNDDIVALMRLTVGGGEELGVADFTHTH